MRSKQYERAGTKSAPEQMAQKAEREEAKGQKAEEGGRRQTQKAEGSLTFV